MITAENLRVRFYRNPKAKNGDGIPRSYQGRAAVSPRSRRNSPRPFARILQHAFLFIQGRFHEKAGTSAVLLEQMFSRFMEGRDPTAIHSP